MSANKRAGWWKLNLLLAAALYLALRTSHYDVALYAGLPLAARLAYRAAVIRSGLGLRRTGRRRVLSLGGKW